MRYKRQTAIIIISVLAALFARGLLLEREQQEKERKFLEILESAYSQNKNGIYLPDLTGFGWNKACFIPPYMVHSEIQKLFGAEYNIGSVDNGDDGLSHIVFATKDASSIAVLVPRKFFDVNQHIKCLSYEEAKKLILSLH